MTLRIKKSELRGFDLASAVTTHIENVKAYHKHMQQVHKGKAEEYPAPHADELVLQAISPKLTPDYEIIDDDPTPAQILRDKKRLLMAQVKLQEYEAIEEVMPHGKRALHAFEVMDAQQSFLKRQGRFIKSKPTKDEERVFNKNNSISAKTLAVQRQVAEMLSEIDDLTEKNIDKWTMRKFK